jgi:ferredoxin-thioredoxin reductase catalytic subunit
MRSEITSSKELSEFIKANAESKNYILNTADKERAGLLIDGLFLNLNRYGYSSCPCRFSAGDYQKDKDIICPCVYMESDVEKYGACFCGLYVSREVNEGKRPFVSIPESRPREKTFAFLNKDKDAVSEESSAAQVPEAVWKCKVCGYEHAAANPPDRCPKCGSAKTLFEKK